MVAADRGGPREGKSQMIYGYWALARVRRWGRGVRGAFVTAASQGREDGPAPALTLWPPCIPHCTRACRDIGAGQKKKKKICQGWLHVGMVSLAQETLWPQEGRACWGSFAACSTSHFSLRHLLWVATGDRILG